MPVRLFITEGTTADCTQAGKLIEGINTEYLLADKAYDTDAIIGRCQDREIEAVILSKSNRKQPREHDRYLYRHRHLVENAFLWLKSAGEALQRVMLKMPHHSWLPYTYDV